MTDRADLRHPAEIRLLVFGSIAAVAVLGLAGYFLNETLGPTGVTLVLASILSLYIARGFINGIERANSIEITAEQFPEVHARIVDYAKRFGLETVPRAYMVQQGGTLNAFASKHNKINFIRINAEIFEVGHFGVGPREPDPEALDFIIAHELGHVAALHTTYWYSFIAGIVFYVPFLGWALSRAREFTADNYAYSVVPDGIDGIVLLSGGKYLYPAVDGRQLARRASTDLGAFVIAVNAISTHPIMTKRLAALYDRSRPGRLF